ncbi:MAG: sugar transferase [Rhodobacteraceae bacterium]|nr:sugar transferase [Paracoccaceae bacterium]MAY47685.1 sugar transferase [Paracoccaceae bacterium]|tara:strand:- start:394 stop:1053 length:660 start_codon:yes stop_codon:yes gene_type:complete
MSTTSVDCSFDYARPKHRRVYQRLGKRLLDVCFVLLALPIVLPLVLLAAALLAMESGRPFYRQDRIGRNGRVFSMVKLRSMVPDADKMLAAYLEANPEALKEWSEKQKLTCDPRITRMGGLLRKTSLDELPQLWNVLMGDMSIVGPRPMMVSQKHLYPGTAYYSVRPGITGLWQISRRHTSSFAARTHFDAHYCRTISLKKDLQIILRTVTVVLRGTGC